MVFLFFSICFSFRVYRSFWETCEANRRTRRRRFQVRKRKLSAIHKLILAVAAFLCICPSSAFANTRSELDETRAQASALADELSELAEEIEDAEKELTEVSERLDGNRHRLSGYRSELIETMRRGYIRNDGDGIDRLQAIVFGSNDLEELGKTMIYQETMRGNLSDMVEHCLALVEEDEALVSDISSRKDETERISTEIKTKIEEAEVLISSLEAELAEEEEELERLAAASKAAESAGSIAAAFDSGDTSTWHEGLASAYGGWSDPGTGTITANGSTVTEWSMGVAIPLAWGRRDLLGTQVEISYNGKSVIATINDLGGMNDGERALDLQPGVFKALGGVETCNAWGVRTVRYRFI